MCVCECIAMYFYYLFHILIQGDLKTPENRWKSGGFFAILTVSSESIVRSCFRFLPCDFDNLPVVQNFSISFLESNEKGGKSVSRVSFSRNRRRSYLCLSIIIAGGREKVLSPKWIWLDNFTAEIFGGV